MIFSDGSREAKVAIRAKELLTKWMQELEAELSLEENVAEGIALPSYMTAGYTLHLHLKRFVESQGGFVTPMRTDGDDLD